MAINNHELRRNRQILTLAIRYMEYLIRADQIRADQIRGDQIRSGQIRANQIRTDEIRADQLSPTQLVLLLVIGVMFVIYRCYVCNGTKP